jgi:hypothetical protein
LKNKKKITIRLAHRDRKIIALKKAREFYGKWKIDTLSH